MAGENTKKKAPPSKEKASSESDGGNARIASSGRKIVYDDVDVLLFRVGSEQGPIYEQTAKDILGWQDNSEGQDFGTDYLLTDYDGKKVRCSFNQDNRPFGKALCEGWASDILHRKWEFNGETIIIDETDQLQQGQHTLIGLVLACQVRRKDPAKWERYWKPDEEIYIEKLVVVGISSADRVINTIDSGKSRTDSDVIFRSDLFRDLVSKDRKKVSRVCALASRLLWLRTGQNMHQIGKSRSHTYMMKFVNDHIKLLDCVKYIVEENGEGRISSVFHLGYASALMYLMGCCKTAPEAYEATLSQESCDWDAWDKAKEFWKKFAEGHKELIALREYLKEVDTSGSVNRDETCGAVVNAWNLFFDGEPVTLEAIHVNLTSDDNDQVAVGEHPLIGGIDVGIVDDKHRQKLVEAE